MNRTCVVCADAGHDIGIGHVKRSLVLAKAMLEFRWKVVFLSHDLAPDLGRLVESSGSELVNLSKQGTLCADAEVLAEIDAEWICFDGEHFCREYRSVVCPDGAKVIRIADNLSEDVTDVAVLVDPNIRERPIFCRRGAQVSLCGMDFCLTSGNAALRARRSTSTQVEQVVVTLGGADTMSLTHAVLEALLNVDSKLSVSVVLGPLSKWKASDFSSYANDHVIMHSAPDCLDHLLASADLGIMAMGGTTWEMCYYGLPFIMMPCHPLQRPVVDWFLSRDRALLGMKGSCFDVDQFANCLARSQDKEWRSRVSNENMDLIDGKGAERVCESIEATTGRIGNP